MKNKNAIKGALLIFVVAIWGYIGFSIFSAFFGDQDITPQSFQKQTQLKKENDKLDSAVIDFSFDDPFLRNHRKSRRRVTSVPQTSALTKTVTPKKNTKPQFRWPVITYSGAMIGSDRSDVLGIFKFNGKETFVKEGDLLNADIRVQEIYKDSAVLTYIPEKTSASFKRTGL
ncbi:MAG: hypothetical protein CL843_01075 [Crocinitomicaceae bacterium]|nr:hypothetical protein [Crocinitomicaceae bacterium]